MASDQLDRLDYYSLLKVKTQATADQIRRAFHKFASVYHPDRHVAKGAAESRVVRAGKVYRLGAEAYHVLCDPARRRQYDSQLERGMLRLDAQESTSVAPGPRRNSVPGAGSTPSAAGPTLRDPRARECWQRARMAVGARNWVEADRELASAQLLEPGNTELASWRTRVQERLRRA